MKKRKLNKREFLELTSQDLSLSNLGDIEIDFSKLELQLDNLLDINNLELELADMELAELPKNFLEDIE